MKVFDLYLGREVAIPERVEAGRFRLTKPAVLNERLQLGKGEVLNLSFVLLALLIMLVLLISAGRNR